MDDLTPSTPCRCADCGQSVDGAHDCAPPVPRSRLERVVLYAMRRQLVRALAMKRKGSR